MIKILKVTGNSMHPTLASGAFVLVWRMDTLSRFNRLAVVSSPVVSSPVILAVVSRITAKAQRLHHLSTMSSCLPTLTLCVGDIIAVQHPAYGQIIKRVAAIEYVESNISKDNPILLAPIIKRFRLKGDNLTESVSEAQMGWLTPQQIIGKVIYVINS